MVEGNIEPWLMTYQVTKKYFILQNTKILRSDRAWCLMNMWNSIKYGFDVSNDGLCLWSSRSKGGMALVLGITKIINVMDWVWWQCWQDTMFGVGISRYEPTLKIWKAWEKRKSSRKQPKISLTSLTQKKAWTSLCTKNTAFSILWYAKHKIQKYKIIFKLKSFKALKVYVNQDRMVKPS